MKILALSDIHGDRSFVRQMAEKGAREGVDLVILAGDLVDHEGNIDGMVGPFLEKGLEVAVLPGNHEGLAEMEFLAEHYGVKNLHGSVIQKGDVGIFGCGYGDIGIHQLPDQEFYNTLFKAHGYLGKVKKKIMVTHVQPSDSLIGLKVPGWGSVGVRKALEKFQPDVHICGHIHETHGIEEMIGKTRVINVGKTGTIIEVGT